MEPAPHHVTWGAAAQLAHEAERADLERALAPEEGLRLQAMCSPRRRRQFLAARWLARGLLAQLHGGDPLDWPLSGAANGPPRVLRDVGAPLFVSLSHSGDVVACAVSSVPIGLDIEAPGRARDVTELARVVCDEAEQAMLDAQPPASQEAFFHQLWTAKEAWIKRRSESMTPQRLTRIHLRPAPTFDRSDVRVWSHPRWTLALADALGVAVHWRAPAPGATAAWCVDDEGAAISTPA